MLWYVVGAGCVVIACALFLERRAMVLNAREASARGRGRPVVPRALPKLLGDGCYQYRVVGECQYAEALERIAGRSRDGVEHECDAVLLAEPDNPHDINAVKVVISGKVVAYIRRDHAPVLRILIDAAGPLRCDAVIVGGWDRGPGDQGHFGVELDILWPPRLED